MKKNYVVFVLLMLLFALACRAQGEIAAVRKFPKSILWDLYTDAYDAYIEFVRTSPSVPKTEADEVRIYFERRLAGTDSKYKPARNYYYNQKWGIVLDTLKLCTVKKKCKVYVDNVYKRDTIVFDKFEYLAYGNMTLKCYDYKYENNVPTGKRDDYTSKGHSYFPITKEFFDWLNYLEAAPVVRTTKIKKGSIIDDIKLTGADRTYVATIDRNRRIVATVFKNRMEISMRENGKPVIKYLFDAKKKSHAACKSDKGKIKYMRVFTTNEKNASYIEIHDNTILFKEASRQSVFRIDESKLTPAINLAIKRGIIEEDDDYARLIPSALFPFFM